MTEENVHNPHPPSIAGAISGRDAYDPFARGRVPVGVRTIQMRDAARSRVFPCEIWYPAAAQHAGQDLTPATQDAFTAAPGNTLRRQPAIRAATAQPGTYPL